MRITLSVLATAALFTGRAFSQVEDKTFYFTQPASSADMTAMATAVRTLLDLQNISIDQEQRALVTRGPVDRLVALDWLFHQLDRPAGSESAATAPYKMLDEVLAVMPVSPDATNADITAVTTAIRTVADIQRLFPLTTQKVLLARGTPEKIAAADFVIHQLLPSDGHAPTADSPAYPGLSVDRTPAAEKSIIQIFRMDPKTTTPELVSTVTAIRTVADLQRLFPFERGKAVIVSGPSEKVAVAEWLVHETAKAPDANAIHQTTMPSLNDGVVGLFYVGKPVDVTPLVSEIRSTLRLMRIFPMPHSGVILRGRADEVKMAGLLVANFADAQ